MTENKDFPNFLGKIERGTEADLADAVFVTEKMDGSYFQFGWYNGEFRYRTKNTLDHEGINDKMFKKVIKELIDNKDLFPEETVFCCEYFRSNKHNSISYDFSQYGKIFDKDYCFLFIIDIRSTDENVIKDWWELEIKLQNNYIKAGKCCINFVPKILGGIGDINFPVMGKRGAIREGIVIKKKDGTRLKFVSDYFKEVACKKKRPKRQPQEVESIWEPYMEGLRARVDKAIFRLKEKGVEFCKESFGKIIGETVNDLLIEERSNIEKELFKFYEKQFKKLANSRIINILFEKYKDKISLENTLAIMNEATDRSDDIVRNELLEGLTEVFGERE